MRTNDFWLKEPFSKPVTLLWRVIAPRKGRFHLHCTLTEMSRDLIFPLEEMASKYNFFSPYLSRIANLVPWKETLNTLCQNTLGTNSHWREESKTGKRERGPRESAGPIQSWPVPITIALNEARCWWSSWSSNILATWCKEWTYRKRPWCWKRLRAGEGDNRGWDGWMASPTQQTWVWANSGR